MPLHMQVLRPRRLVTTCPRARHWCRHVTHNARSLSSSTNYIRAERRSCAVRASTTVSTTPQLSQRRGIPDSDTANQFDELEALAKVAGVQRLVRCGPTPLGRGLVAKQPLDRQTLVSVPLENALVITDEPLGGISVFGDRCQEAWQEAHGRMPQELLDFLTGDARWDVRMTAWLLWVASELPDSPVWGPYIANLPPADEVTCLINYGPDDAKELQIRELVEEAETQHVWATNVHRKYFDATSGELRRLRLAACPQDTLWAMSMVRTRTFSESVNGEDITLMVPYADLANHSFRHNATFCMSRDNKRFELRLLCALGPGEVATISYGESKPNAEVMRDYGFVVPGNPNDRVQLPAQQQAKLPPLNGASLLEAVGFRGDWRDGSADPVRPILEAPDGDADASVSLARRRCALLSLKLSDGFPEPRRRGGILGAWQAKAWTDAGRPPPQPLRGGGAAAATERSNATVVRQAYQITLEQLPTAIATDSELLACHEAETSPLSGSVAAAVRCRLEHKLLLREAVSVLETYERWLS